MRSVLLAVVLLAAPAIALAQAPAPPASEEGRFVLRETPEGLLRMDGRTGQISLCARQDGTFACRLVPDDRAALEAEIGRLKAENEALRRGAPQSAQSGGQRQEGLNLPSDAEVDRALSLAERIWRRLLGIIRETEQEQGRRL